MIRKIAAFVAFFGSVATLVTWGVVALIGAVRASDSSSVMFGYARADSWLVNAVVNPDGTIVCQFFDRNLTPYNGAFAQLIPRYSQQSFTYRSLVPALGAVRFKGAPKRLRLHCLTLVIPLLAVAIPVYVVPILRRRRRRRNNQCLACGYDLTGNVSGVCPECGVAAAGGTCVDGGM